MDHTSAASDQAYIASTATELDKSRARAASTPLNSLVEASQPSVEVTDVSCESLRNGAICRHGGLDSAIPRFRFAKAVDDGTFSGLAVRLMLTEKFGAEGRLISIDFDTVRKKSRRNFPLKSTPYDFDGSWVGILVCGQEKTQLDQRPSWVLNN
ncbi:hypothetical protein WHT83_10545 [Aminobacter sp. P9b]|uniref:hypothetical protein n=1 Tax=Aminobacter sp. P9b TaxID=3133697 RepID=UPI00324C6929